MKFFLTTIACRLRLAFNASLFAALLLFIVFLAFVTLAFGERQGLMMNVGLFYPDTEYAEGLAAGYELYAADTVSVARYSELEPMLKDVAAGRLECAYALPDEYIKDARIDLYVTPDTIGEGVSNVLMASTYMQSMAADLGYKVLKNYVDAGKKEITAAITEKNLDYLGRGAFMNIDYLSQKRGDTQSSGNSLYYALNSTVALFSLLITMLFCLGLMHEGKTAISMRLRLAGDSLVYYLGNIAAVFLLNIVFFAVARLVIGLFFEGRTGAGAIAAYAFFISVLGVSLGDMIKSESLFLGVIILGFLCTAVLGGVFIDIGGLIPQLDGVKYLFATYYFMEGLKGSAAYVLLAVAAVALIGASAVKKGM